MNSGTDQLQDILEEVVTAWHMEKDPADIYIAKEKIQQVLDYSVVVERKRWITPVQSRVYDEIRATLSPRITDIIRNTGYGNGTVQKALKKLVEVGLVKKGKDNIYENKELAKDWQDWQAEQSLSYGDVAEWSWYFTKLARKFELTDEFKENGII